MGKPEKGRRNPRDHYSKLEWLVAVLVESTESSVQWSKADTASSLNLTTTINTTSKQPRFRLHFASLLACVSTIAPGPAIHLIVASLEPARGLLPIS
jgi:hypothetical protein